MEDTMPVHFTCPFCGHQTLVGDEYVGQTGPCGRCGHTVTVGAPAAGPAPAGGGAGGGGSVAVVIGIVAAVVLLLVVAGGIGVGVVFALVARQRAEIAEREAQLRSLETQRRAFEARAQADEAIRQAREQMDAMRGEMADRVGGRLEDLRGQLERLDPAAPRARLALPSEVDGAIPAVAPGFVRVHFKGPPPCSIEDLLPGGQTATCPCRIDFRGDGLAPYEFNFTSIPEHEGTEVWALLQVFTPAIAEGAELEVVLPREILDAPPIGEGSLPRPIHFIQSADDPGNIEVELAPLPSDKEALAAHNRRFEEARDSGRLIAVLSLQKKHGLSGGFPPQR
jgi:hypothetical protein